MKKFISAAATLAMAASMAVSAVPFTTGAADASKTLEIRAFENASTTIDTTSADVTVPVGLYIVEGTNDCQTISSKFTVHSKDGDASAVKFEAVAPGKSVGAEKDVTIDGESYKTDVLYNFAGEPTVARGKVKFVPTGTVVVDDDETGDPAGNETNYVASLAWTTASDGTGYKWTGSKSDDYPIFVVNVTFPKGTKSGTYTIDFLDYLKDAKYPEIYSNLIEVGGTKYSSKNANLNLKGGLEIKVNGGGAVTPTPTAAPVQPTAAPAQPTAAPGTSTEDKTLPVNSEFKLFAEKDVYEIQAGSTQKDLCLYVDPGTHSSGMYALEFGQLPEGFTISKYSKTNEAAEDTAWNKVGDVYFNNSLNGGDPIKPSTEDPLFYFDLDVASTVADGEYTIPIKRLDVIESKDSSFAASVTTPIKITVTGGAVAPTTTAAPAPTAAQPTEAQPTAAQPTEAQPTAAQPTAATNVTYGDTNCDGKVNIADVVILNKYLTDKTSITVSAQGLLNADCCDPTGTANPDFTDSKAIIKSIVHLVSLPAKAADIK